MIRAMLVLALVAALAACQAGVPARPPGPVTAHCDALCFAACVEADGDTGVRWQGEPVDPAAWDALGDDVVDQLTQKLRSCEVRRRACVQCLDRLERERVIVP